MKEPPCILVVDDDESNRKLLGTILSRQGLRVYEAADGIEALDQVRENPPELILLDINMPNMNGFEVARRLKENEETKIIPIVVISSLSEIEDRVKALECGADDFLSKPVDKTELKARVQSLLKVKAYNDHLRAYQRELEEEVAKRTEELKRASEKIKMASLDTIFRLSQAAEYKDEETGAHIVRMGYYSAAISRRLGLDPPLVESILYAAPMHDIGKIGIPDRILLKPGKLDSEEWETMKQHTLIGAQLLKGSDSEILNMAEVIALTHHERWDGSGYPHQIKENKIPVVGRISAIADVFDALTSKRPYKDPYSLEESFNIIAKTSKSHFDPEVTEAFFGIQDEILFIRECNRDEANKHFAEIVAKGRNYISTH